MDWGQLDILLRRVRVASVLLINSLNLVATLIGIFSSSIGLIFIAWIFRQSIWVVPICSFLLGSLLTLAGKIVLDLLLPSTRWIPRGYRIEQAEYRYQIHDKDLIEHTQTTKIHIRALRPGLDIYEMNYRWTGSGEIYLPVMRSVGHKLQGDPVQQDEWQRHYIHLGRDLVTGDVAEIETFQEFFDFEGKFKPRLTKEVIDPIKRLILCVTLPPNREPINISYQIRNSNSINSIIIKRTPGMFNYRNRTIVWEITRPAFGRVYEIRWDWDNDPL